MRHLSTVVTVVTIVLAIGFLSVACHNDGGAKKDELVAGDETPDTPDDGGDNGGDDGDDGGDDGGDGGGGGGGGNTDTRFVGTWISSYGDDLPAGTGRRQYAMRIAITRNGDALTGNGQLVRFYNAGPTPFDDQPLNITASGAATNNEATLTLSGTSGVFANNPTWYLRNAGSRLVGMYAERDANLVVKRSGHALWYAAGSVDLNGSWAAAFDDEFGVGPEFAPRDRTAIATLSVANNVISGVGSYVEQRATGTPEDFAFDVGSGSLSGTQTRFSFVDFSPQNGEVDWFGYHSGGVIVAAYGQFNNDSAIVRSGNATWYEAGDVAPADFDRDWITSFGDSAAAGNLFADYVMAMSGVAISGNAVSGTVRVLDETSSPPAFVNYTIENAGIVGNRLTMDMVRNGAGFTWSLRLAGNVLAGSYTQFDSSDAFVSRGHAEWRFGSAGNLPGNYVASYFDTSTTNTTENRASQLSVVTIDALHSDGTITGTGSLRLGGESNRRQFSVTGTALDTGHIVMTWESGADLFGDTVWNLRKAGNTLYGTYSNFASDNQTIEFQGHATFLRVSGN